MFVLSNITGPLSRAGLIRGEYPMITLTYCFIYLLLFYMGVHEGLGIFQALFPLQIADIKKARPEGRAKPPKEGGGGIPDKPSLSR